MLKEKFLKLGRTFKEGLNNFFHNFWLSFATVSILALSLYVVSATALLGITGNSIVNNIKNNINISIYLNPDVSEEDMTLIRQEVASIPDVVSVEFISNDQALDNFINNTGDDPVILDAIDEIGDNPLFSSLVVTANNTNKYDGIVSRVENSSFTDKINSINYARNKEDIEKINVAVEDAGKAGMILGGIFILISILITFNTIRLTMYSRKREFEIMRLVGASNMYIQMPMIFEGILYGIFASLVAVGLLPLTTKFVSSLAGRMISQESLHAFYFQYLWIIFAAVLAFGILLGVISSFIAIRRYLKI
ncbi:MAG: ABC transporter permease [Candidatus Moranbacteria bacterium]|jgi:cell division transport system permease protein|nr:ABC transporter permease [Candidatus Moranbacteria bacterium]